MLSHHTESIRRATDHFKQDPEVLALILGGSLAHGFARPDSDVDVMIVVGDEAYALRQRSGHMQFFDRELCTYGAGYVDGKYLRPAFVQQVAECGSEPARFAFQDAQVLFSRVDGLEALVKAAARYPAAGKAERLRRFYAQFEAWNWYCREAVRLNNCYLLGVAVSKLVLFGGRLVLAHNERLYPYHKWFLRVLEAAPDKPPDLLDRIWPLYEAPGLASVQAFYEAVRDFQPWPSNGSGWPSQFMRDSELNWLEGPTPVDDL
jgi:hypothetical protein